MLLQLKFQNLRLIRKFLRIELFFLLPLILINCSSIPVFSSNCNFPDQSLEPGGIVNSNKSEINVDILAIDYIECGVGKRQRIIAPISYNYDKKAFKALGLEILDKRFRNSYISITENKFNQISEKDLIRIDRERTIYIRALEKEYSAANLEFPLLNPSNGIISSEYGVKRFINNVQRNPHLGLDIAANIGEPVYASADGIVLLSDEFFYKGNFVLLGHGNNFKTSYSHLNESFVTENEIVKKGQLIGLVGKSGRVTGPHLHFEVIFLNKKLNPELFIQ